MSLSAADFNYIRGLVSETTHNVLETTREYAVETRLQPLLEANKLTSLQGLIATLRKGNNPDLKRTVVETLLNNETMFFRDMQPFEMLRTEILPDLINKQIGEKTLTIWSAACS